MSDVISIELLLDPETEAAVRGEWQALADAGLSSLAHHTAASNRPHLTVIARTSAVSREVGRVAGLLPLPVTLGPVMLFGDGDRRVLVRLVTPSRRLLDLHAAAHEAAGPGDDLPHTSLDAWVPHVTLARRLRTAAIPEALTLLGDGREGEITSLRKWDAATRVVTDLGG